jgi:hypothetical protein
MDRNEAADYFSAKKALDAALDAARAADETAWQADISVGYAVFKAKQAAAAQAEANAATAAAFDRLKVAERALDAVLATIAAPV